MAGEFKPTLFGAGRRMLEIPPRLAEILDTTYRDNKDFVVLGREDDDEVQDIIRYGRLYAQRKNLSFRHVCSADGRFRFRLKDKRPYQKRDIAHWNRSTTR
jgi:hypothetical protein